MTNLSLQSWLNELWLDILSRVEKPSRYLGNEWNAVYKDSASVDLRVGLVFPDLYELGLGNLGLHILYSILNKHPRIWAERVYAPGEDLEQILRNRDRPLFLWESKHPISCVDLLAFTLQSELTYTTVLNILDLSHIPIYAHQRNGNDPLVCAGGPCVYNPEPMAPFIDFFVIGEGEQVITEIAETLLRNKYERREKKLEELSKIDGIYVPQFVPVQENEYKVLIPVNTTTKICRRIEKKLELSKYIENYIVPYTQLIHEGLSIEIMRGCTRGCRFCLAGFIYRPVRERNADQISELIQKLIAQTGLESVSLVSLSSCDHSEIIDILQNILPYTRDTITGISLPSLRADAFSVYLADAVSSFKRSGLTFAPEAGTESLRKVVNKSITDSDLLETIRIAFQRGWQHVKLYFMIGLPTETDEDLQAIVNLSILCLAEAKKIRQDARIHLGISTFVPKPWTPFQWARQITIEETQYKQQFLLNQLRRYKSIKISFHSPIASFIEGILSRGDRNISKVIHQAWRNGAKLETSTDKINLEHWLDALMKNDIHPQSILRERDISETFPWEMIDPGIQKDWLIKEWQNARERKLTPDCRESQCQLCGIQKKSGISCFRKPSVPKNVQYEEKALLPSLPKNFGKENVQSTTRKRLLLRIGKIGPARFLSHLEFQTAWIRALRRAHIPVEYSQGYHAHAKVSFALPAPVGEILLEEFMEIWMEKGIPPEEVKERLLDVLPEGFEIFSGDYIPIDYPAITTRVVEIHYAILIVSDNPNEIEEISEMATQCIREELKLLFEQVSNENLHNITNNYDHYIKSLQKVIVPPFYYVQWYSPVIKNQFIKPKKVISQLHSKFPHTHFVPIRCKTVIA